MAKMNIFDKARATPTAKAGKEKAEEVKLLTKGLEEYAMLDALKKQIDALMKAAKPAITDQMYAQFLKNKGETYKGEEKLATSTMVLSKRNSTSGLNEMEAAFLEMNSISTTRIEGDFKLNIDGVSPAKLQEVSDAISKIKGLPEDFLEFDASKARTITTDKSIEEAFRLNDVDTIKEVLKIVGTPMIKPKTSAKAKVILEAVKKLVEADEAKNG